MRNISERAFVTVFNLTQKLFRKRNNDSIQFYDKADIDFINIRVKNKIALILRTIMIMIDYAFKDLDDFWNVVRNVIYTAD